MFSPIKEEYRITKKENAQITMRNNVYCYYSENRRNKREVKCHLRKVLVYPLPANNRVQHDAAGAAPDLGATLKPFPCHYSPRSTTPPAARLTRSVRPLDAAVPYKNNYQSSCQLEYSMSKRNNATLRAHNAREAALRRHILSTRNAAYQSGIMPLCAPIRREGVRRERISPSRNAA